jgi:paired box protein 6
LRTQRRSVDHISNTGGTNGTSGGTATENPSNGGGSSGNTGQANGNIGNTSSASPPVSTTPRLPLNSGFNSMYPSIPQPIATIAENYR